MNRTATWLSIVAIVLVGILYILHFTQDDRIRINSGNRKSGSDSLSASSPGGEFRMAYFEMDSIDNNYEYLKEIKENFRKKEEGVESQLRNLRASYQKKISEWQQKGSNISQAEGEAMNKEYQQMEMNFNAKQKQLGDELERERIQMLMDVQKKIAEFLKEYNKDKGYQYIITNEQSLIYYKDTVHNITKDVVEGLNEKYKTQKKKN